MLVACSGYHKKKRQELVEGDSILKGTEGLFCQPDRDPQEACCFPGAKICDTVERDAACLAAQTQSVFQIMLLSHEIRHIFYYLVHKITSFGLLCTKLFLYHLYSKAIAIKT